MVTFSREASPSSTLAQSEWACSSAFQADASERASSIVFEIALAAAARPQAMLPLPAIAGLSYPSAALIGGEGVYHGLAPGLLPRTLADQPVN